MKKQHNPTINGFTFWMGDVNYLDYDATWMRQTGKREFHFITLINWEDSVGEREAREIGETYKLRLSIVDLSSIPQTTILQALECCGQTSDNPDSWIAYACMEYGAHAPIQDVNTSNFRRTFSELARESRAISGSKSHRRTVLAKKVNRLGSTAREFMQGDIKSALVRGIIAEDPTALLVGKMYAACAKGSEKDGK